MKVNFKSDFTVTVQPKLNGEPVDITQHDFRIVIFTENCKRNFVCSSIKRVQQNCTLGENGEIICHINNHNLKPGKLHCEIHDFVPDSRYPDGHELKVMPIDLDVSLVTTQGDGSDFAIAVSLSPAFDELRQDVDELKQTGGVSPEVIQQINSHEQRITEIENAQAPKKNRHRPSGILHHALMPAGAQPGECYTSRLTMALTREVYEVWNPINRAGDRGGDYHDFYIENMQYNGHTFKDFDFYFTYDEQKRNYIQTKPFYITYNYDDAAACAELIGYESGGIAEAEVVREVRTEKKERLCLKINKANDVDLKLIIANCEEVVSVGKMIAEGNLIAETDENFNWHYYNNGNELEGMSIVPLNFDVDTTQSIRYTEDRRIVTDNSTSDIPLQWNGIVKKDDFNIKFKWNEDPGEPGVSYMQVLLDHHGIKIQGLKIRMQFLMYKQIPHLTRKKKSIKYWRTKRKDSSIIGKRWFCGSTTKLPNEDGYRFYSRIIRLRRVNKRGKRHSTWHYYKLKFISNAEMDLVQVQDVYPIKWGGA